MYSLLEDSPGPVNTYFTSATAMDFVQHEGGMSRAAEWASVSGE
jgi:hypothetical protein